MLPEKFDQRHGPGVSIKVLAREFHSCMEGLQPEPVESDEAPPEGIPSNKTLGVKEICSYVTKVCYITVCVGSVVFALQSLNNPRDDAWACLQFSHLAAYGGNTEIARHMHTFANTLSQQ